MLTDYSMCKHVIDLSTMICTTLKQGLRDISYENQKIWDVQLYAPGGIINIFNNRLIVDVNWFLQNMNRFILVGVGGWCWGWVVVVGWFGV